MASLLALIVIAVLGIAMLALFVWWLLMLIDAIRVPVATWEAAGQNQILHVLLMVFLGIIGTIVYVAVAKPAFRRVGAA